MHEGLGYVRFAELPDFPIGHSKIFLKKSPGVSDTTRTTKLAASSVS